MGLVTKNDAMEACGTDQLCSGVKAGIEGAVHTINKTFQENCDAGWGLLLSDGDNAFNSMSRFVFFYGMLVFYGQDVLYSFSTHIEVLQFWSLEDPRLVFCSAKKDVPKAVVLQCKHML